LPPLALPADAHDMLSYYIYQGLDIYILRRKTWSHLLDRQRHNKVRGKESGFVNPEKFYPKTSKLMKCWRCKGSVHCLWAV